MKRFTVMTISEDDKSHGSWVWDRMRNRQVGARRSRIDARAEARRLNAIEESGDVEVRFAAARELADNLLESISTELIANDPGRGERYSTHVESVGHVVERLDDVLRFLRNEEN